MTPETPDDAPRRPAEPAIPEGSATPRHPTEPAIPDGSDPARSDPARRSASPPLSPAARRAAAPTPRLRRGASAGAAAADAARQRPAPPTGGSRRPADDGGASRVPGDESPGSRASRGGTASRPAADAASATPGSRDESTEFLLQSLRDLDREREAGDIDEDDYRALHDDYTVRAAAALRAEERGQAPPVPPSTGRSWLQRGLILLGVAGFAVLSGVLVAQAVGRRDAGEGVTGEVTSSPTQEASRCIGLTNQQSYIDALTCYQEVLEGDPDNVVARTYLGWTLVLTARQAGDALSGDELTELYVQARTQLDRAAETDPRYADARAFQVVVAVWEGRYEEAQRQLALFDELDAPADMQRLIDSQRQAIADGVNGQDAGEDAGEGAGEGG